MKYNQQNTKQTSYSNNERKARTRTLIQLGGLLDKAGLTDIFDITPGEDLQGDLSALDKASTLLGFLVEAAENNFEDNYDFNRWNKLGAMFLQ